MSSPGSLDFHLQEAESLRREVLHREQQLAQLEQELVEKSSSLERLRLQLDETRGRQAEHKPPEAELAKHAATPPRGKVRRRPGGGWQTLAAALTAVSCSAACEPHGGGGASRCWWRSG